MEHSSDRRRGRSCSVWPERLQHGARSAMKVSAEPPRPGCNAHGKAGAAAAGDTPTQRVPPVSRPPGGIQRGAVTREMREDLLEDPLPVFLRSPCWSVGATNGGRSTPLCHRCRNRPSARPAQGVPGSPACERSWQSRPPVPGDRPSAEQAAFLQEKRRLA